MEAYRFQDIEPKWQQAWANDKVFQTPTELDGAEKAYILDFFPYPSGAGLHVGHIEGYTGTDVVARVARMQGKKVLHPMGWDAFGLPAENYAIKSGVHPAISTENNIKEFHRQIDRAGLSYDWEKELATCRPEYYKWTQWLFGVLYKRGLAYRKDGKVNWCPSCQTVLANEQVINSHCDRCGTQVQQKQLKQWYFKITDYADRLLEGLDGLDWPEHIKQMQRNWIGKSSGAYLTFNVFGRDEEIKVFTTRADTTYGVTYLVLAPEHELVDTLTTLEQKGAVAAYVEQASLKTELERSFLDKEKTGVFTGSFAVNMATGAKVPIWVADYVISTYGTGAVMAVPSDDARDNEFATVYGLPIQPVVDENGRLCNSGEFNGLSIEEGKIKLAEKYGELTTTYRLRDWLVSRQRFWGAPIPIIYDQDGAERLLDDSELPVVLPEDVEFLPTGQSPLSLATDWKTYTSESGQNWTREVDTLDTFVCSSWYFLRFPTPHLATAAFDAKEVEKWLPVDMYVGGAEHAVLHLLYARFFTKVLFDAGLVSFQEPFQTLRNPGTILGPDHNKMSKSKGNVINPDDVINQFGADTLRVFELFLGPFEAEKPWNTASIIGIRRFLEKVWRLQEKVVSDDTDQELAVVHATIKKVSQDIANFKFNTAIAALMEMVNFFSEAGKVSRESFKALILLLNPFAPFITEELWQILGETPYASVATWPIYDERYIVSEEVEYPVQINGKVRFKVSVPVQATSEQVLTVVRQHERYHEYVGEQVLQKEIVVPGRLVSLVV